MTVQTQDFRNAMALLGAAVNIITTDGPRGRGGFTASTVCSVTDTPPTLLICMNRNSVQHDTFLENGTLCVNTLRKGHTELSRVFSGQPPLPIAERFAPVEWTTLVTSAPVLKTAAVAFDCRIVEAVEKGTHSVFFAEVVAVKRAPVPGTGLIYFNRGYHVVGAAG